MVNFVIEDNISNLINFVSDRIEDGTEFSVWRAKLSSKATKESGALVAFIPPVAMGTKSPIIDLMVLAGPNLETVLARWRIARREFESKMEAVEKATILLGEECLEFHFGDDYLNQLEVL